MRLHDLKCWPGPFQATWAGVKTHEVRVDDRGYQRGDRLMLREYYPDLGSYTGREILADVTYLTLGDQYGLPGNLVVMSTRVVSRSEFPRLERRNMDALLAGIGRAPSYVGHEIDGKTTLRFRVGDSRDRYVEARDSADSDDVLVTFRDGRATASEVLVGAAEIVERVRSWLSKLEEVSRENQPAEEGRAEVKPGRVEKGGVP